MNKKNDDDNNQEFLNFLNSDYSGPLRDVDDSVLSEIKKLLDPPFSLLLLKLALIHAFMGLATMLFCPQFQLSLTANDEIYHFFHRTFGYYGCLAVCGLLFLGSGSLVSSFLLSRDEVLKINRKSFLFFPLICLISLLVFIGFGAEAFIDTMAAWSLGGVFGSMFMFFMGSLLKRPSRIKKEVISD